MSQNDKIASDLQTQFNKMRRGVKQVVVAKSGKILVFCKSELSAMAVKIDLLRVGRRDAKVVSPTPYTMGCYVVEC